MVIRIFYFGGLGGSKMFILQQLSRFTWLLDPTTGQMFQAFTVISSHPKHEKFQTIILEADHASKAVQSSRFCVKMCSIENLYATEKESVLF